MIKNLSDLYFKEGQKFIELLFNNQVEITEKVTGTYIGVRKNSDDTISFFKKDGSEINYIDRVLNKLYEEPIKYITNIFSQKAGSIPNYSSYQFQYFHNNKPNYISYDRLPKNGLILISYQIPENEPFDLDSYAELFEVDPLPIIFNGYLSDDQKKELIEYLKTDKTKLVNKFKVESFTKFMISLLNPSMSKSALQNDIDKPIDSIIFSFGDFYETRVYAKMVDPIILNIHNSSKDERIPSDISSLILFDFIEFAYRKGVNSYELKKSSPDSRYVELICMIYNDFMESNKEKFNGLSFETPEFAKHDVFSINSNMITDDKTLEIIEEQEIYKQILQLLLGSFKKKRKKQTALINNDSISLINNFIEKIEDKITIGIANETDLLDFGRYMEQRLITNKLFTTE